jgi:hypothetical protein
MKRYLKYIRKQGRNYYLEFPFFPLGGLAAPDMTSSFFKMASSSPSAARLQTILF